MRVRLSLLTLLALLAAGCGAGAYSFSREYVPLSEEDELLEAAADTSYEDVRRDPNAFRSSSLGWFGVVTNVEGDPNGSVRVALTHRIHQPRHLCGDETDGSCRVTVSERESGPFSAVLTLRSEDRAGTERVGSGSLLRVYGSPTGEFDEAGGPVIQATYYRHWPRGYYVTTGDRGRMRR